MTKHPFAMIILMLASAFASVNAANVIPLAGEWRFEIAGTNAAAYAHDLPGTIQLPGTIDDAGLGPKNTNAPTLIGPYRLNHYAGPAWYQRDIEIPVGWAGKRVTLFLERCRWVTTVWLDGKRIGTQDSLIAPHVYDFGIDVTPGKHRLTICVDNTVKIVLGNFVSALFGGTDGNMNGIVGRIELAATPPVWLDEVQVYPDVAGKKARLKVRIGNATGQKGAGRIEGSGFWVRGAEGKLEGKHPVTGMKIETAVSWDEKGGQVELEINLGPDAKLWNEYEPHLYEFALRLGVNPESRTLNPEPYVIRFGMRNFSATGKQFTMNGRPIYLRGVVESSAWPLTGYPPTDPEPWRRIYRIMKSYGMNHIRFHSWCPPEAAFVAADEEGMIIQAEGPMCNVPAGKDSRRDAFIEAEFKRIVDAYGNHPSFCLMALGNEFEGDEAVLTRWVDMLRNRDTRRLYSSPTSRKLKTANRQFTVASFGKRACNPGTLNDCGEVVAKDPFPVIGHEVGQWLYWPDFNEIGKWTGVMRLKNYELIRDDLARKHLLDLQPQFVQASGKFATLLYKEEIEAVLRTSGCAGFGLLDLHDYPAQGTAIVGPLDAFWDSKGFITPEAFSRYCGPTVPLLRMPKRTYTVDEPFEATVELAHYGATDLARAKPVWTITDGQGREIAAGALPVKDIAAGALTPLGAIKASLAKAEAPDKLKVTVSVGKFVNDWEIWVYPANVVAVPPADVSVCGKWDQAKAALAQGRKVVYFPSAVNTNGVIRGQFPPIFWSPVWAKREKYRTMGLVLDPKHPLFAQFPTEFHTNWQWYELMQRSQAFILDDMPADFRPAVQVIDNFARNHKLGIVFEGRVGAGQFLVCGFNLPAMNKDPAARQLLASLYQYVGSEAFHPTHEIGEEFLEILFSHSL
jgi:hypothetical protein